MNIKKISKWSVLGLQNVFAMFGATVLVALLTGLDVGVTLVASGVGTLIYIFCTKGKVPMYLGSSFAYIGAISSATAFGGFESAFIGLMVVGIIYVMISFIISKLGKNWIRKLLPPVVVGPMIIIIGMSLAPLAIQSAGFDGSKGLITPIIAIITFLSAVFISIFAKGFWKVIPFILAILIGYIAALILGIVDYSIFSSVRFFEIPNFTFFGTYKLDFSAVLTFAPIAFVTMAEHIGDHAVLSEIIGKDILEDPGLDKTLLGDGLATLVSAMIGGPANTSYGENIAVAEMTGIKNALATGIAAIFAIILGFFGYIQAFIQSIPEPVIGGMTIILYGLIASSGVRVMIKDKTNLSKMRNLIVVSSMLVIGLGGATFTVGSFTLIGMSLSAIVGIVLNKILPN